MTAAAPARLLLVMLPWLAACGGSAQTPNTYTKIDDMEAAGITRITWMGPAGTTPSRWFTATDCAEAERVSPLSFFLNPAGAPYDPLPSPHETMPGTFSTQALRFRTVEPLVNNWGANIGFTFGNMTPDPPPDASPLGEEGCLTWLVPNAPAAPVDLTAFSGVTFWARAETPGSRVMLVQFIDVNTDPRGGICQETDSSEAATSTYCYNGFGTLIQLSDMFTQYTVDFSQLAQHAGWGYHPPSGADWSQMYSMNFQIDLPACSGSAYSMCAGGTPTLSFDVWIDDLYFVNR
jgi:hypothetical protein